MLFTSATFFFYFLPIFLILYRSASKHAYLTLAAKIVLICGTYIFYGFENTGYLLPFAFATILDLIWSLLLARTGKDFYRKAIVVGSVLQNLSLFFVFKYLNAISGTFPDVEWLQNLRLTFAGDHGLIALPPGISFYLFESLSYVIDCYRRTIRPAKNPLNFLVFISMFPRFIAGPIVRYADLEDSIVNYRGMRFADGMVVFMFGFILKTLFADSFGFIADQLFGVDMSFAGAWSGTLAYTFQLYLDFSAYSLMAIGLGMVLGFPFPDNFREPYSSSNIAEFWRRWHISLSTWLRDYLYIPLGGNRGSVIRTNFNLFATMVVGGIWHGANLTFVIWGAYHGLLLIADRVLQRFGIHIKSRLLTFFLVIIGWCMFRAKSVKEAASVYSAMFQVENIGLQAAREFANANKLYIWLAAAGFVWAIFLEPRLRGARNNKDWHTLSADSVPLPALIVLTIVFIFSICVSLSAYSIPFLYFQF